MEQVQQLQGLLQCSQPIHQLKLDSLSAIGCGEPVPGRDWTDSAHISSTVYTFYKLQGVHCQKGSGRLRLVVVVQGSRKVRGPVFKGESSGSPFYIGSLPVTVPDR